MGPAEPVTVTVAATTHWDLIPLPLVFSSGIGSTGPVLALPCPTAAGPIEREIGRGLRVDSFTHSRVQNLSSSINFCQPDHIADFIKSSSIPTWSGPIMCILFQFNCTTSSSISNLHLVQAESCHSFSISNFYALD